MGLRGWVEHNRPINSITHPISPHVFGVRPDCIESRRGARKADPREWCTDGLAVSACAPGIFGPVAAFRGEIEAQGRGSLHPHVLVWLVLLSISEVVEILHRDREQFQRNIHAWMAASVAAAEAICQSSVRSLPRHFGNLDTQLQPLGFSETERKLSEYDGGSELDKLEAIPEGERSDAQREVLEAEDRDAWCRPCFPLRDVSGNVLLTEGGASRPRESVYGKTLSEFAVGQYPAYRRRGPLKPSSELARSRTTPCADCEKANPDEDASRWESAFAKDVRELAQEIYVHICGESCHKYSGQKVEQICRHGFYYIVNLGEWARRKEGISFRRRGKRLRDGIFVVKSTAHGMQGRLLMIQEHPFEVQTNYAASASLRCNFDVQDLRRVLPEHLWNPESIPLPALRFDEAAQMGRRKLIQAGLSWGGGIGQGG